MLSLAGYNFYIYTSAADMRMGINGLSGIVRNQMALDPLAKGIIYLFFNGRLTQVKMLGLCKCLHKSSILTCVRR